MDINGILFLFIVLGPLAIWLAFVMWDGDDN